MGEKNMQEFNMRIIVGFQAVEEKESATSGKRGLSTNRYRKQRDSSEDVIFDPRSFFTEATKKSEPPSVLSDDEDDYEPFRSSDNMGECSLAIIDHGLTSLFYKLGVVIGKNPTYFIIIPIFVSLLLGTGLQRLNYVDDPEYLFSPVNGAAKTERQIVEEFFPMNYSGRFDLSRFVRPGRFAR